MRKLLFIIISCVISAPSFSQQLSNPFTVFTIDNFPSVYGGNPEWKRFIHDHLVYPREELQKKVEGTVKIIFVVTENGKAAFPKLAKSVSRAIDKEALRLLNMLDWLPTLKDGKPVNINHAIEINFSVSKYKKWVKERGYDDKAFPDFPADTSLYVYETADKGASFYNTEKNFPEFISSNIEYPEEARRKGLEGNIAMSFIIEPDGRVSNIRIQKGVSGGCNEEALRVIALTTWTPAVKNNKYIRFRMYYTMSFSIKVTIQDNNPGSQRMGGQ